MKQFRTAKEQRAIDQLDEADKPILERLYEVQIVSEAEKERLDKLWHEMDVARTRATRQKGRELDEAASWAQSIPRAMESVRRYDPHCTAISAASIPSTAPFPISLDAGIIVSYVYRCTEVILNKDDKFFAALSRALRGKIEPRSFVKLVEYLQEAYVSLQQAGTLFPTKKQVRDLALLQAAIDRVLHRPVCRRWDLNEKFPPAIAKRLRNEIETLHSRQTWPRLWKTSGLNSLDNDRGGAGQHRERPSPTRRRQTSKG